MEEEDDAWSYSFPPSSDMLPLNNATPNSESTLGHENGSLNSNDHESRSTGSLALPDTASSIFTSSNSISASLQPLFMPKATLADPLTTMRDANSIISKEGKTNALASASTSMATDSGSPPLTPTKSEFQNSIRIWQQQATDSAIDERVELKLDSEAEDADGFLKRTFTNLASSPMFGGARSSTDEPPNETEVSPKIIAYRKTSHKKTESDSYGPSYLEQTAKFDPKLYVEEKFKNTDVRYATMKRNVEFHQLFRSMDLTDRLLDDFACALSREILLQGRIYLTEQSVCFNSNLLGWVTSLVIPFDEITRIDKKSTAGLFPNGISVETKDAKHNFASFLSRDVTYDLLRTVWQASTGKNLLDLDSVPSESPKPPQTTDRKISSYIMTLDGDDNNNDVNDENYNNELESSSDESELSEDDYDEEDEPKLNGTVPLEASSALAVKLLQLKPESKYKNMGPEVHHATVVTQEFSDADSEIEVCNEAIEAPMGIVFDILFGSNDTSFHRRFLEEHDASEISEYGKFLPLEDDPTKLERRYTYRRALGYSIGPKSTKCLVSEEIEHLNFADYIVVLSTTATPDVPSGGSFTVKTRYYFTWGEGNTTNLRIAFFIKWTGRSWIKNVVEKLTLSAQAAVTVELIAEIKKETAEHTQLSEGQVVEEPIVQQISPPKPTPPKAPKKQKAPKQTSLSGRANFFLVLGCYLVLLMLIMIVLVQLTLARAMVETRLLMQKQLALTTTLVGVLLSLGTKAVNLENHEKNELWQLVYQKEGRVLSRNEQAAYLAQELMLLLGDDTEQHHDKLLKEILASLF